MDNIHKKQSTWCHMQLVKSSSPPTKRQGQTCGEFTPHPCGSWLWKWSCHWPLNLPSSHWQRLGPLGGAKTKKSETKNKCLINHFRLFRRHLGASRQFFIEMLFLTLAYLALAFDIYRSFPTPRGPGYLFTANKAIFEAFPLLPPHVALLPSLFAFTSCCTFRMRTSLVAHQRKSILSILLWLPILTLPVSGTAVRQLSPFPCWWQGFVFFPATWESWF